MRLFLDCVPCLHRQVLEAARMASSDEAVHARVLDEALITLAHHRDYRTAPALAQAMHEIVKRQSGLTDPYHEVKQRDMVAALRLEPTLRRFALAGPDTLLGALKVSATGNVMDSALYADLDIEACVAAELAKPFARCDRDALAADLAAAGTVLIIGDNAGEAVFDKALVRELAAGREVFFAVRGEPIINDVTADDARFVGLGDHATIVSTGCGAPGAILDSSSAGFRDLFDRADVIISKGQGNFEALSDAPRHLYFLLKAKCPRIAHALAVTVGDYVLAHSGSSGRD